MNHIPIYGVMLVRDSSLKVADKKADSPGAVADILKAYLAGKDREHFVVLLLDARRNVIGINTVSIGTLTASLVHPAMVFKPAILANAAAIVISHNHLSGETSPSSEDKETTKRLSRAGELLGICVLDHVIISFDKHFSFKEAGLI